MNSGCNEIAIKLLEFMIILRVHPQIIHKLNRYFHWCTWITYASSFHGKFIIGKSGSDDAFMSRCATYTWLANDQCNLCIAKL